jgi:ribosomal protein L32E
MCKISGTPLRHQTYKLPTWKKEKQVRSIENIFNKILTENVPNLEKEMIISRCNIIPKTLGIKNKERILKAAREKSQVTYNGRPTRITDFSIETLKARRACNDVL